MNYINRKTPEVSPGPELLNTVKAGFVLQGTTYTQWCKANAVERTGARAALLGGWRGPKAKKLVQRLIKASGADAMEVRAA